MGDDPSQDDMNTLLGHFGTHVVKSMSMGSKFIGKSTYDKNTTGKSNKDSTTEGSSFSAGAIIGFNTDNETTNSSESNSQNSKTNSDMNMYTLGTPLPTGGTMEDKLNTWAGNTAAIMAEPVPIANMELVLITDAIRKTLKQRDLLDESI
jgi:hypothetical protein